MIKKDILRAITISAVCGQFRRVGQNPVECDAIDAWACLDELARGDKTLLASRFYLTASNAQYKLFVREWGIWRRRETQND